MDSKEWPSAKYVLTERAYVPKVPGFDCEMLDAGTEIIYDGKPGPHMQPTDDAGRAAVERAGDQTLDWTSRMTLGGAATDEDLLVERISRAVALAMAQVAAVAPPQPAAAPPAKPASTPPVMQAVAVPAPALPPPPPPK